MEPIKAFVGHSFSDDDREVVRRILELLDQLSKLQPGFSWEHAEAPEPQLVTDKVLARFEGKNVFIGICTRKERVVEERALRPSKFSRSKLVGNADAFSWKTSDWLIQEIGLAIGREMKVVLLLEEGIRRPGDLQGNLEFVEFERNAPEKCVHRLMGMIAALTPTDTVARAVAPAQTAEVAAPAKAAEPDVPEWDWKNPRSDWTEEQFQQAMFMAILDRLEQVQESITRTYLASNAGASEENRRCWNASVEFERITWDRGGSLRTLRSYAEQAPSIGRVWAYLARAYRKYGEHSSSAAAFEQAVEAERNVLDRIGYLGEAALEYREVRQDILARSAFDRMRGLGMGVAGAEEIILRAERAFADKLSENEVEIGSLERLLEIDPTDADTRFSLAYKYGELNLPELAAYHYARIPRGQRSDAAWNNLGVAYGNIGLPGLAVTSLRESEQIGETLAMSNLANRLIDAGFFDDASEMLKRAIQIADHHKNVDLALGSLKSAPEKESEREGEIFERAERESEFMRRFGRALGLPSVATLQSKWSSDYGEFQLSDTGSGIRLIGTYEVDASPLVGALMMGFATQKKIRYEIEFTGIVYGRAIVGEITRRREGEAVQHGLLGATKPNRTLMWISDDERRIHVTERTTGSAPRSYVLTASEAQSNSVD